MDNDNTTNNTTTDNTANSTTDETVVAKNSNARKMGPVAENSDGSSTTPAPPTNSDGTETQMGTPPEMNCDENNENCEMPEPPEGFTGEMPADLQSGGFRGGELTTQNTNSDAILHPAAYLGIGAGSVIIGILISYACFSKFFHLKPGQTFNKLSKFIWFIVVAVVIASIICLLGYFIPVWCNQ